MCVILYVAVSIRYAIMCIGYVTVCISLYVPIMSHMLIYLCMIIIVAMCICVCHREYMSVYVSHYTCY